MRLSLLLLFLAAAVFGAITLEPRSVALVQEAGKSISTRVKINHPGISNVEARLAVVPTLWLRYSCTPAAEGLTFCDVTVDATDLAPGTHRAEIMISGGGERRVLSVGIEVTGRGQGLVAWPPRVDLVQNLVQIPSYPLLARSPADRYTSVTVPAPWNCLFTLTAFGQETPVWFEAHTASTRFFEGPANCSILLKPSEIGTVALEVPVTIRGNALEGYLLPQVADGGGFRTQIVLLNPTPETAIVQMSWFRSLGSASGETESWLPGIIANQDWRNFAIEPGASVTFETRGDGAAPTSGWVKVASTTKLKGLAIYRQRQPDGRDQEATVPLAGERMNRFWIPFDQRDGLNTAIAYANGCAQAARVRARILDDQGRYSGTYDFGTLPSYGHRAAVLTQWFPESADREGSVEFFTEDGCIVPIALRFTPQGAFTSLIAHPAPPLDQTRLIFPQVADGGGFSTTLILNNLAHRETEVTMKFWRQSTPGLTGIWKPTQVDKVRIPGMTTIRVSTSGLASTPSSGWAELTSDGARLEGIALFRLSTEAGVQEATVRGAAAPAARFDIPFDNRSGFVTSLAIANPDSSTINTQWAIRDSGGRVLATELISLEGGGHLSFELPRRFPASQGASGTIQVTSPARSLYILPLRFNSSRAFTSLATQPE